ncbi:MAG: chromosome partitioning protein ParB [Clostridiales bacterium 43-6]|nr:MAG: chromosome partitioning protein ParB [Clostridiales bacterium 43-6]
MAHQKLDAIEIPLSQIDSFPEHPFKVINDDSMQELVHSIKENGLIMPAIVRKKDDGRYELISGHRRKMACELAGLIKMEVAIKELDKDAAIITMVDSNMQRESILPSEKAFAYKMKLEALKHQGKTSAQLGQKFSVEIVADQANESRMQVQRYIRLTNLIPELLQMVDENKIAFSPAVELSYLAEQEQYDLLQTIESEDCTPSLSQAQRMKQLSQQGSLSVDKIFEIMTEEKANQKEKVSFKIDDLRLYFPDYYTAKQMQEKIMQLLSVWKEKQRDKGAR